MDGAHARETGSWALDSIRYAPAREEHAPTLARLVRDTGPVTFDFVYGGNGRSLELLTALCAHPGGLFGTDNIVAAYDGETLLGIENGFAALGQAECGRETSAHLHALLSHEELREIAQASRIINVFHLPIPKGAYYIQNLSVVPELRGRRIGERLIERAFARARDAGYDSVLLDVSMDNPAYGFYQRLGMVVDEEIRHAEYERTHALPGQYRMLKRLT